MFEFKIVPDYEFAMVNQEGILRSTYTGNIVTPFLDKDGYYRVKIWCPELKKNKGISIHRAKAKAFIPNPENKPCINHKDCVRTNNDLSNLEWVTIAENNTHGLLYGSICVGKYGEENPNNTLSVAQVHLVCELLAQGVSQVEISSKLAININTVYDIRSGKTWKEVSDQYSIAPVKKKLTDAVAVCICDDIQKGLSNKEINEKYNLKRGVVSHIRRGNTFKHITSQYCWDNVQRSVSKT